MQVFGSKAHGARLERMQASARFRDGTFRPRWSRWPSDGCANSPHRFTVRAARW